MRRIRPITGSALPADSACSQVWPAISARPAVLAMAPASGSVPRVATPCGRERRANLASPREWGQVALSARDEVASMLRRELGRSLGIVMVEAKAEDRSTG